MVSSKDDSTGAADEMNAGFTCGVGCGILISCHSLCVSLKRDVDLHPPLSMATLPIDEVDVLKILGI